MKTSMMSSTLFISVILAVWFLPLGYSLRCYSYICSYSSSPSCAPPEELTCPGIPGVPMAPDRCITQRFVISNSLPGVGSITINQEIRNCSYSSQCSQSMFDMLCNTLNTSSGGLMEKCEMGCCEGDLCNSGGPIPTPAPQPTGPSGADLSCLACSNVPTMGVQRDCNNPVTQTCGAGQVPFIPQDRCMTVKTVAKLPGFPQPMEYRMKNCSNAAICNQETFCATANTSVNGALESCQLSCCFGNLCNRDSAVTTTTTTTVATAETTPHGTIVPSMPSAASEHILTDLACIAALISSFYFRPIMA